MTEPFEVITMGRSGVDLYPLQTGVGLARVETFQKFLGGSPTNVAVAAARLGRSAALVSRTGQDPFGEYVREALRGFGVADRWVTPVPRYPTPVTFCEVFPPDDFPLYFYREPKAPDLEIRTRELDFAALGDARVLWMTGTGLCAQPSRSATLAALAHRSDTAATATGRVATVFDLDWRPMFWERAEPGPDGTPATGEGSGRTDGGTDAAVAGGPDGGAADGPGGGTGGGGGRGAPVADAGEVAERAVAEARRHYRAALRFATVAVGNVAECAVATGEREPEACAEALLAAGVELAVVKRGPEGVLALRRDGTRAAVPPHPVEVVNGLGAGDAFGGALCHGLLAGWELEYTLRYANAAGALVASRLACSAAMPEPYEIEELLRG
ncbi:5-dehydro-2-deoxygluconokinase [Streptomyces sp. AJS327]|uniref:5-dehydro-2-deoxygluconokinase n=1 Tax=Streptomyces sp. AJS327 TaxID=2545265 RepID=UPI0015DE3DB5|nr:5-dehydro-2-deoxygluconokinase [Streptomyces sp. AJS327]MBA0049699.1 5-dehydro-2-deoxygluconokinase [Streptomyces sp. AJS327]